MELQTTDKSLDEIPPGFGVLAVMGLDGDTKHIWDKTKPAEVEAARLLFQLLVKEKKYSAFRVKGEKGDKDDEMVKEFDPTHERLIFTPQIQGG